jgi:hypothetical protein
MPSRVTVPAGPLVTGPEYVKLNESAVAAGVIASAMANPNSAKTTFFLLIVFSFSFSCLVLVPPVEDRRDPGAKHFSSEPLR